ncbi:hypothetical protein AMECASPLE_010354, partial [Ameca splendens]
MESINERSSQEDCSNGGATNNQNSDMYLKDIQTGVCAVEGEPVVEKESAATALVDGKNLLGPVVGNFCMNLAIRKAKEVGIGWVVAHGTNLLSVAAPAEHGDSFVLDTATSTVAIGKVELNERRGDPIPDSWDCDPQAHLTTDPKSVLTGGGPEEDWSPSVAVKPQV